MSEQKVNYMAELDLWSEASIIGPLHQAIEQMNEYDDPARYQEGCEQVKKAIREKVLESYKNGLAAKPAQPRTGYKPRGR